MSEKAPVIWHYVDLDGNAQILFSAHPSRDLRFYLRFFEQYCLSHPIVDPAGKAMLIPGIRESDSSQSISQIWEVPLDGSEAQVLDEGVFGVYGPLP